MSEIMDLGTLTDIVLACPAGTLVMTDMGESVSNPHSYRGFYEQLAVEPTGAENTLSEVFGAELDNVIDTYLEGWKGGDFYMDSDTPVWLSYEGTCSGRAIVGAELRGNVLVLITEEDYPY